MYNNKTLCWKCSKAYGDCEWTEIDPETGRVRFDDVPGWTVERKCVKTKNHGKTVSYDRTTVIKCPKFEPDRTIKWEMDKKAKEKAYKDAVSARIAAEQAAKQAERERILRMI